MLAVLVLLVLFLSVCSCWLLVVGGRWFMVGGIRVDVGDMCVVSVVFFQFVAGVGVGVGYWWYC